ncbi:MAG TPA: DUF2905 domain-containing protein [Vicinamibacterales bacterium]|nr:DUF2905 domain-containing protein [Vicinamibacterales bacterium]
MSRALIIVGLVLLGVGLLMKLGMPIGRLPGDIVIRRGNGSFYFPIVTCLIISVVLSLMAMLLRR